MPSLECLASICQTLVCMYGGFGGYGQRTWHFPRSAIATTNCLFQWSQNINNVKSTLIQRPNVVSIPIQYCIYVASPLGTLFVEVSELYRTSIDVFFCTQESRGFRSVSLHNPYSPLLSPRTKSCGGDIGSVLYEKSFRHVPPNDFSDPIDQDIRTQ